ncbi:hypothetical protein BDN72DRAFT_833869 [Pluteus cervinus]|uniref:Uncharacterized protein n=1 Tax=Pluteus cervinus TaxID=181527 RepID=A0ACD3B936_9AGAR|nr:hypothetical protein BDN72DRAFT_833869 [Pluteus cervinus]
MSVQGGLERRDELVSLLTPTPGLRFRFLASRNNLLGNTWANFLDSAGRKGYHYLNVNGSYYLRCTNGTRYFNNGRGYARLTTTGGLVVETKASRFRANDFSLELDIMPGLFNRYCKELLELANLDHAPEKIKQEEPIYSMNSVTVKTEEI